MGFKTVVVLFSLLMLGAKSIISGSSGGLSKYVQALVPRC